MSIYTVCVESTILLIKLHNTIKIDSHTVYHYCYSEYMSHIRLIYQRTFLICTPITKLVHCFGKGHSFSIYGFIVIILNSIQSDREHKQQKKVKYLEKNKMDFVVNPLNNFEHCIDMILFSVGYRKLHTGNNRIIKREKMSNNKMDFLS